MRDSPGTVSSLTRRFAVIAGPGVGKTHLLLAKLKEVLSQRDVEPSEALVLLPSGSEPKDLRRQIQNFSDTQPNVMTVGSLAKRLVCMEAPPRLRRRLSNPLQESQKEIFALDFELSFPDNRRDDLRAELGRLCAAWASQPFDRIFQENEWRRRFKATVMEWLEEFDAAMPEEILHHAMAHARKKKTSFRRLKRPRFIFVDDYQNLG